MRNPLSSSPADRHAAAWHREPWPWILIGLPLTVVVASIATAIIAMRTDDGVVAGDSYKRGLLVNDRLPKVAVAEIRPRVTVTLRDPGEIVVTPEEATSLGPALVLTVTHPATATTRRMTLLRTAEGDYVGALPADLPGRWTVAFDAQQGLLPTALVMRVPGIATMRSTQ